MLRNCLQAWINLFNRGVAVLSLLTSSGWQLALDLYCSTRSDHHQASPSRILWPCFVTPPWIFSNCLPSSQGCWLVPRPLNHGVASWCWALVRASYWSVHHGVASWRWALVRASYWSIHHGVASWCWALVRASITGSPAGAGPLLEHHIGASNTGSPAGAGPLLEHPIGAPSGGCQLVLCPCYSIFIGASTGFPDTDLPSTTWNRGMSHLVLGPVTVNQVFQSGNPVTCLMSTFITLSWRTILDLELGHKLSMW